MLTHTLQRKGILSLKVICLILLVLLIGCKLKSQIKPPILQLDNIKIVVNPEKDEVMKYIADEGYKDDYWFFVLLTKHESGTHNQNEYRQFNPGPN